MPQNPSGESIPTDLIGEFKGINDQVDSVSRPKGATTDERNILDDQTGDASRRLGRSMDDLDDGNPVGIIYQLTWDDGSVTDITGWSSLRYGSFTDPTGTISVTDPTSPGPIPLAPNYIPMFKNANQVPDLTSLMRAISQALNQINGGLVTWPDQSYYFDAYEIPAPIRNVIQDPILRAINLRAKGPIEAALSKGWRLVPVYSPVSPPSDGEDIPEDFYYADYRAIGLSAVIQHLATIISNYNSVITNFVKTSNPEGLTSVSNFTSADYYGTAPSASNWLTVWTQLAALINENLSAYQYPGSISNVSSGLFHGVGFASESAINNCADLNFSFGARIETHLACLIISSNAYSTPGLNVSDLSLISSPIQGSLAESNFKVNIFTSSLSSEDFLWGNIFLGIYYWGTPLSPPTQGVYQSVGFTKHYSLYVIRPEIGFDWVGPIISSVRHQMSSSGTFIVGTNSYFNGWQVEDAIAILYRNQTQIALGPGGASSASSGARKVEEVFSKTSDQSATSETFVNWETYLAARTGAASRDVYSTDFSSPLTISSDTLVFDSTSGQMMVTPDRPKPALLIKFTPSCYASSGSPGSLTVRFYINNALVKTVSGVALTGATQSYLFSFKNVGSFGTYRPPQNDSNHNLDGWDVPVNVRVSVQPDSGTVGIGPATNLTDSVMNYPF